MNTLRTLIVDDESLARRGLKLRLQKFPRIEVVAGHADRTALVYDSPVTGTVTAVNEALSDKPETINEDAYGEGWMFTVRIEDAEQLNELLSPDEYAALIEEESH